MYVKSVEPYVCKCDKGVWGNLPPLEQKYSCERSEWALCTLMNKYKKKDCNNYMPSFTDEASDSDGDAKKVRTTGSPGMSSNYIRTEVGN